ncbi:5,6-dimethylbenzimidazole synthase [compost metagenome]
MSILDKPFVEKLLQLPKGVELVAYLCVGYPKRFGDKPMLEELGWKKRLALGDLVFENAWGQRLSSFQTTEED